MRDDQTGGPASLPHFAVVSAIGRQLRQPRRWPAGLIGALALIVAVESVVAHCSLGTLTSIQWEYRQARRVATGRVVPGSVLAFGDSMVKLGLIPAALESATGRPAYNFALTGGQAPATYCLLAHAIRSGTPPAAVLVDFFPNQLACDPAINLDHWPFLLDPAEAVDLTWGHGDANFGGRLAVRSVVPSVRSTLRLRRSLTRALAGQPDIEREALLTGLRNWEANQGHQDQATPGPPADLAWWVNGYFGGRTVHPTNRDYIHRFLRLAEEHAIPVFWLLPPYQPVLQAECERSGFDRFHEAFVRDVLVDHPGVRVIDARRANYDPQVFQDPHHLINPGARVYSAEVGAIVRRELREPPPQASRWIPLPPYRPVPAALVAVETLDESRAVLVRSGRIRR